jgi:hypothetical protein
MPSFGDLSEVLLKKKHYGIVQEAKLSPEKSGKVWISLRFGPILLELEKRTSDSLKSPFRNTRSILSEEARSSPA